MGLDRCPADPRRRTITCDRCERPYELGLDVDRRDVRLLMGMAREDGWREVVAAVRYVPAAWLCPCCVEELQEEGRSAA